MLNIDRYKGDFLPDLGFIAYWSLLFAGAFAFFLLPGLSYAGSDAPFWRWAIGLSLPAIFLILFELAIFSFAGAEKRACREKLAIHLLTGGDVAIFVQGILWALTAVPAINIVWVKIVSISGIKCAENQFLMEVAKSLPIGRFIFFVLVIAVAVPFAEEIIFRRALYGLLGKINWHLAFFGTAAIFSAVHFFINGLPGLFALGIIFQATFVKSRNLLVPVLVHCVYNAVSLLIFYCFE